MKKCPCCQKLLGVDQFYKVKGRAVGYCKNCNSKKGKVRYQEKKELVRSYNARPDVIIRTKKWKSASPRHTLSIRLNAALKRRPCQNPVTLDELMEKFSKQGGLCHVSGLRMVWREGMVSPFSLSLDRIDSKEGYTADNVRLVCLAVNVFKGRWSDEDVVTIARAIVQMADIRRPNLRSA